MKSSLARVNQHPGPLLDTIEGYDVIDCSSCQFAHVTPIPTNEELKKLYAQTFYASEKTNYFKDAEEDLAWWTATYKNYLELLGSYTKGRKLLDIGSGPGYFLKIAKELDWKGLGFEPSKDAYEYSSGLGVEVINDFFDGSKAIVHGQFDVVCLNLVLEHLPDPIKLLTDIKKILTPGGLVFILSPNDYNPLQKILRDQQGFKPWWVVPTHHLNYFNFQSLAGLLKKLGFSVVDTLTTYPMEFFLLGGKNYIGNREVGRACHQRRKNLEINLYGADPTLLNSYYRSLAKNNIGREVVMIGRKNDRQ